jgi:DNA-directed RNA polymerase subunit RPC12/RpoP
MNKIVFINNRKQTEYDDIPVGVFEATEKLMDTFMEVHRGIEKQELAGCWMKEETIYGWDGHSYQCSVCGRSIHLDTEMEDLTDYPYCHCGSHNVCCITED